MIKKEPGRGDSSTESRGMCEVCCYESPHYGEEDKDLRGVRQGGFYDKAYAPKEYGLCVVRQRVLRRPCIVLPHSLQARALELAIKEFLAIVGTKQQLGSKIWLPGMDKERKRKK